MGETHPTKSENRGLVRGENNQTSCFLGCPMIYMGYQLLAISETAQVHMAMVDFPGETGGFDSKIAPHDQMVLTSIVFT